MGFNIKLHVFIKLEFVLNYTNTFKQGFSVKKKKLDKSVVSHSRGKKRIEIFIRLFNSNTARKQLDNF